MTNASSAEGEAITCPVCKTHTHEEVIGAEGLVLAAAEALSYGREADIAAAYEASEKYDFHIAVTMYVDALEALASYACVDFYEMLADQRRQLNESIGKTPRSPRDPGSSNNP